MKTLLKLLLFTPVSFTTLAQQTPVPAADVIAKINRGEAVSYENVVITGDLDLTELANKRRVEPRSWASETYLSVVTVPLTFRNCTFAGNVVAYKNQEKSRFKAGDDDVVQNTDFREAVRMEQCMFQKASAFKYSHFRQRATFAGSQFTDDALFKYADFAQSADFSNVVFGKTANFKYTEFRDMAQFASARFADYADFKYTKFHEQTHFAGARFGSTADFKYVSFPRDTNFERVRFDGLTDFKYTTLAGRRYQPGL